MKWRYTLIDRFGTRTRIDQPVGWDTLSLVLKRHPERHGTFREVQTNQFRFYNTAMELLKAEYEQWGIRGDYDLLVQGWCGNSYEQVYRGKISFDNYNFVCGVECYVVADCDQIGPLVDLINRFDQKVEIGSLLAFDKITALSDYATLTKVVTLPSKAILLRASAKNTAAQEYIISDDSGWFPASPTGFLQGAIALPFNDIEVNNINKFKGEAMIDYYNWSNFNEQPTELIENVIDDVLHCVGTLFTIEFRVKGRFKNLSGGSGDHTLALALKRGTEGFTATTTTQLSGWILHTGSNVVGTYEFDITFSGAVSLSPGENLYLNPFLTYNKFTNYSTDVRIEFDAETFFKASVTSKCDPTDAKVYLVHETTSRVIESITNGALQLSSSFYGRRDSMPVSFPADGCGGLRAITPGLDIRRAKLSDGSAPKLFLSLKGIFESLNALDNIGLGPEGNNIVVEDWRYFYQDEVIFTCKDVEQIEKVNIPGENYSLFKVGFDKWETEDYDGLDEFLTKREYRTELSQVQNTFEQFCKFIASGYAWETTRRKGPDSKDWRYDNDTFILCLTRKIRAASFTNASNSFNIMAPAGSVVIGDSVSVSGSPSNDGTYTVTNVVVIANSLQVYVDGALNTELAPDALITNNTTPFPLQVEAGRITGAANLLDPDTVYNFRISPARNAMRWFNKVANCYRNITNTDALVFSAGDGNYLAAGLLMDDSCRLEGAALAENAEINLGVFADAEDGKPFTRPERIKYSYPVSFEEFNLLKANSYKLVAYSGACEKGEGWIDVLEYVPEEGKAKFTLIPKVK